MKRSSVFLCVLLFFITAPIYSLERGIASYYAGKFQGRLTANGEIFDTNVFTAAHKSLPFNTIVRVVSDDTGLSVLVRINDRGPFVAGRIIDLSRAGAEAIDMVGNGLARVSVRVVILGDGNTFHRTGPPTGRVAIQIGAFREEANAEHLGNTLRDSGFMPVLSSSPDGIIRVILPDVAVGNVKLVKLRLAELGFLKVFERPSR